ncbi:MAG: sulfatase [Gemmataceae bacterium]|nr:sulfatase [Gemmataceae bacterium]
MSIRRAVWITLALSVSPTFASEPAQRPNFVILVADDLRADVLGCYGDRLAKTPNLDQLAGRGTLFRNAFVTTSICCVSRASIMTGQYARRHGIHDFKTDFSPAAFANTYMALLKAAGYRIGFIGKYGVGTKMPEQNQFDFWKGFPGQGNYFDKDTPLHMTRRMGDQTLEFLKGCDRAKPFCLSVSFKSPHAQDGAEREFPPDPADESEFKATVFPTPRTASDRWFQLLPEPVRQSEARKRWQRRFSTPEKFQQVVADYYRLVTGMDREIGRIVAELARLGLADNTILIFTSDNGFFLGERGLADKWFMYEESIRVPCLIVDPRLPRPRFGQALEAMALNIDLAPTILDYAGLAVAPAMQGKSLRPLIEGKAVPWRHDWFYEHHTLPKIIPPSEGVRTTRWTYLRWVGMEPIVEELYDLANDPFQEHNLIGDDKHRVTLERLRRRWAELRLEVQ